MNSNNTWLEDNSVHQQITEINQIGMANVVGNGIVTVNGVGGHEPKIDRIPRSTHGWKHKPHDTHGELFDLVGAPILMVGVFGALAYAAFRP